uniref:Uncharacterized protein n=1 Tax=Anguilla anguilla TaxID=7936 RepID=A0A0E9SWP2_ANGAN
MLNSRYLVPHEQQLNQPVAPPSFQLGLMSGHCTFKWSSNSATKNFADGVVLINLLKKRFSNIN